MLCHTAMGDCNRFWCFVWLLGGWLMTYILFHVMRHASSPEDFELGIKYQNNTRECLKCSSSPYVFALLEIRKACFLKIMYQVATFCSKFWDICSQIACTWQSNQKTQPCLLTWSPDNTHSHVKSKWPWPSLCDQKQSLSNRQCRQIT